MTGLAAVESPPRAGPREKGLTRGRGPHDRVSVAEHLLLEFAALLRFERQGGGRPRHQPLQADGLDTVAAVCDVCDRASVAAAFDAQPRVDALVCAAGIYDDQGKLVAGLSISAPADRLEESWVVRLKETAAQISAALGHRA